jgi:hypothetical protein
MRYLFVVALLSLVGCQDRYRYYCQDPGNWEKKACKKPICSSSYTCPDQVSTPEVRKVEEESVR